MSAYYPVLLKLDGKRCVVVGGGHETTERVRALMEAGADVTLIAAEGEALPAGVSWVRRDYAPGDLEGAFLVVACPADRSVNERIFAEAEARGIPVNCVDDTVHCSFIFPAVYRQGALVVAVSSSGKSPAVASQIRDRIAGEYGPEYGELLELLGALRAEVIRRVPDFEKRRELWRRMAASDAVAMLKQGRRGEAEAALRALLEEE